MELYKNIFIKRNLYTCTVLNKEALKSSKSRSASSHRWLTRQLKDPYVEKARQENYRCRSAFKLLEINKRFNILTPGLVVVDCGAAPGSWTQVALKLTNAIGKDEDKAVGRVFAIDRLPIHPIDGATILGNADFTLPNTQSTLKQLLNGQPVDVVLSDMAPNATGVRQLDHDKIMYLAYSAMKFAVEMSKVGGTFVTKVWDGQQTSEFEKDVEKFYKSIKIIRPPATRDESAEMFILAQGFKGLKQLKT
ncbi:rRNA methyltransferase 2, mitochondrial [Chelonus insularis]|uniref:rRNA methyltransferase 2, mitochondrial n=1 Tax=Chelonus insularis TaxID=460826 RepID=UPI00158D3FD6|nr:rRNA methyltransferase 2, mitochondrial [Chelonus insularis]